MTTLEDLQEDLKEFRKETNVSMDKINGRLRTQELVTAYLKGAGSVLALLGIGNVVAIVVLVLQSQ